MIVLENTQLSLKESWAPKNWCFWIVVLEKTPRVHWTARRSNQSILKEIIPEYCLEGLMLKLEIQYFGHLIQRTDSLEKILMLGKTEGRRRMRREDEMVGWMASPTRWTWVWASSGFGVLQSMRLQRIRHDWAIELTAPFYFLKYVGAGVKKVGYICIWSKYTAKCQNGHRKKLSVVLKMCVLLLAPRAAGWREEWEKKGRQRDHWHASRWERRLQFQSVTMWKESSGTMRQSKMRVWL